MNRPIESEAALIFDRAHGLPGISSLVFLAMLLIPWGICAQPVMTAPDDPEFDCVMEPQQLVKLASPVVGVIGRLDVDRGDVVHKGQILGKLEDDVEQADVALARAKATNDFPIKSIEARLTFLRRKHERADLLVSRNAAAQSTLDEAESDANVAEHQLKEAELNLKVAQLELNHAEVTLRQRTLQSPFDGVVVERLLLPGEYRNDQSPILTLAQIDPLRVEVFVPIRYYGRIRVGNTAKIRPEEPIGGSYNAAVIVVDRVMDAASGTFGVRLTLPNPELELPAGVRCKVAFGLISPPQKEVPAMDHSTTQEIKLPISQPPPTMSPMSALPTGDRPLPSPSVAIPSLPATGSELQVAPPATPLQAPGTSNAPPPAPPAATLAPPALGDPPLPVPPVAIPSPKTADNLSHPPPDAGLSPTEFVVDAPSSSPAATVAPAVIDRIPLPVPRRPRYRPSPAHPPN
jgi:RND family efflux transporter MFP subunit